MTALCDTLLIFLCVTTAAHGEQIIFQDNFAGKLGTGWSWIREHPGAWRVTQAGLEVRIEPGNMWGPQNNARNVLVRSLPVIATNEEVEISVQVENKPTNQYEQVDLVWYYDDSHMVKLGQELVDGSLSVVMGREEKDQCRTVAIVPIQSASLRLRLFIKGNQIRGQFRIQNSSDWVNVGECTLPTAKDISPKVSLQFYQGLAQVEHWARVTEFQILKRP